MFDSSSSIGPYVGDYRLTVTLTTSPTHTLFLAEKDAEPEQVFLVKRRTDLELETPEQQEEFLQRAKRLKKFRHPFVLPIIDAGLDHKVPYIVTIYKENGSLFDIFKQHSSYFLPLSDVYALINRIGEALQAAHQNNIIHGNLKPQNILFDIHNNAFLADFLLLPPARVSTPEQPGNPSKENDQYALGCIAYELLTGQRPFIFSSKNDPDRSYKMHALISPQQLNASLTYTQEHALLKSLDPNPELRHSDIRAFLHALNTSSAIAIDQPSSTQLHAQLPPLAPPVASLGTNTLHSIPAPIPPKKTPKIIQPALVPQAAAPSSEQPIVIKEIPIPLNEQNRQKASSNSHARTRLNKSSKSDTRFVAAVTLLALLLIASTGYLYNYFAPVHPNSSIKIASTPFTATDQEKLSYGTPITVGTPFGSPPTSTPKSTPTPTFDSSTAPTPLVPPVNPTPAPISTPISAPTFTPITTPAPVPTPAPTVAPPPTPTPTPEPTLACHITYAVTNTWPNGFTGSIQIVNTGSSTINGWNLVFGFPNGQQMTYIWNATANQSGSQVTMTNAGYNSTIPVNGSASLGFNASWNGNNGYPTYFILNGTPCN